NAVVTVVNVAPTGYNGTFVVTASNSSSFQYTTTAGLGAGTVFGTASAGNITTIAPGAFTLANGVATNTSAYNDLANMWTAECSGANCSAFQGCSPLGSGSTPPLAPAQPSGQITG